MKKIGIVITNGHIFSNGMNQNALFLYILFTNLGITCDLLSYEETYTQIVYESIPVRYLTSDTSKFNTSEYSIIITVSTSLDKPIYEQCQRTNTLVIGYVCSNQLCMAIEETATCHTRSSIIGHDAAINKAWIFDGFPFMKTYIELLRGVKAQLVPHVWNTKIVEFYCRHISKKDPELLLYNPTNHTHKKITIMICESNINFVKTAVLPLMAAEKLNTVNPELIDEIFVFSYPTESIALNKLISELSIRSKVRRFTRQIVSEIFIHANKRNSVPVFVCNQIYTPLNYSYYEIMYYGYPFVHNSPVLKSYGNFYQDLDIDMCAVQIYKAYQTHADESRVIKNREYLNTIDPTHPSCLERWRSIVNP